MGLLDVGIAMHAARQLLSISVVGQQCATGLHRAAANDPQTLACSMLRRVLLFVGCALTAQLALGPSAYRTCLNATGYTQFGQLPFSVVGNLFKLDFARL